MSRYPVGVPRRESVWPAAGRRFIPGELSDLADYTLECGLSVLKHLYNGLKLGRDEVESIAIWQNEGGWDKALNGAKPWLLY